MRDAGGSSLDELEDLAAWKSAAAALADLQIQSTDKVAKLREVGCRDLRIANLLQLVDPYLDVMAELMAEQAKIPPPALSRQELSDVAAILKDCLCCLAGSQIPETLGHSDFNPGNIIVGSERCAFIDWAEAHISHPFLTFEYLIAHLRKDHPELSQFENCVRSCYVERWQSALSSEQVSEAFLGAPLVAVFAYAVAGGAWRDRERLLTPQVPGYLRSLTRRMKQEADLLQRRRVVCLS